CQQYNKLPYIF
nr:immunoglobulin light chain junction region [Macaca mulatta]MOX53869.1 immunoglobulin light chain junction region [Macaca mulatta]MOX55337.1 immunoglobulin light chain junction region [Macaca mulatta]MOX56612.1 immunoglobulin light chain junction region [Macaca mulatta]